MSAIPVRYRIRAIVGSVFRRPIIRSKNRFLHLARTACLETQQATRQRLLRLNQDSDFAREHGLNADLSVEQFRRQLTLTDYETYRPFIQSMQTGHHAALLGPNNRLLMYAITSGTTSEAKLIPVTTEFLKDYRRGWQNWGIAVMQDHPVLKQLRMVQITSNHQRYTTADGIPCGNISGLVTAMQKPIVRRLYSIPAAVAAIDDAEAKRYAVARFAYADRWVGMLITANPSTAAQLINFASARSELLIRDIYDGTLSGAEIPDSVRQQLRRYLKPDRWRASELQRVVQKTGQLRPSDCWPMMSQLGVWTGGSAAAYLPELQSTFGAVHIRDHGLHASEGRMTIPFDDDTAAGILDIQTHYFEFVPVPEITSACPVVLEAHELQPDTDYYILLTTSSGFYRYQIYDVVRCTGYYGTTPLLEFRHKGAHISSITGEKITESQVVAAVIQAAKQQSMSLSHFTLTPVWGQPPAYQLFVGDAAKASHQSIHSTALAAAVDAALQQLNCEYQEKRATDRLGPVCCELLPAEVWQQFTSNRLAASGGSVEQYKHPCLLPDPGFQSCFQTTAGLPPATPQIPI